MTHVRSLTRRFDHFLGAFVPWHVASWQRRTR